MPTNTVHPEEVLKALLAKGNRQDKVEKLNKVYELCGLEYSRNSQGARDFSLANISKLLESQGLFKARTIYTTQSADYVALIDAWKAYNGTKESKQIKKQVTQDDKYAFLKQIEDPAIRCLCQIAVVERDKLKAELNLLKSKTEVIVDMRPLGAEIPKGDNNNVVIQAWAQLTDSERNALVAAIDPKTLALRKWRLGNTGEILDERDRFVFMPGFATAIAKMIGKGSNSV